MAPKTEDCPLDLRSYLYEIDLQSNRINSSQEEILNGHLLALFFYMKKQKSTVFQRFYDILKKHGLVQTNIDISNYNKVYRKCYSVVNKYNSLTKKGKRYSTICTAYLKSSFSLSIKKVEGTKLPQTLLSESKLDEDTETGSPSTSSNCIEKDEEECIKEEGDTDIYERYFDLISQKLDAESKNEKLAALMEDAMSKLHDAELHTHKLNTALNDLREELKIKTQIINKLESKLKVNQSGNNTDSISQNDDLILKLKSKNKSLRDLLKEKLDDIKVLKHKLRETNSAPIKKQSKARGKRKKPIVDSKSTADLLKEKFRKDLEEKIDNLIKERNSAKISEMLLESFPDISISDFEVILKVLTDSNALLEQKIVHKWNVDGQDVTYYGVIKENLINQKKFYITYWEEPELEHQSDDYEIVEYNSLIADIILKDLTFIDPCSLF